MNEKTPYIPRYSEELDEIISKEPGRLLRYGIPAFTITLLLLLGVTWLVEYPEKVNGSGSLYAVNLPKPVIARTNGRLASLWVKEGDTVKQGACIGLLQTTGDYKEILELEKQIKKWWQWAREKKWTLINISEDAFDNLGELQSDYLVFYEHYITVLTNSASGLYEASFLQALNKLSSEIASWKQQYLFIASVTGIVTFPTLLQENQELNGNQVICYIEAGDNNCLAQVEVGQENFGKIMTRQPVIVRLPSYPSQEFGNLRGEVQSISRTPNNEKKYLITVAFPNGLVTDRNQKIRFVNELSIYAEIITRKRKLFYKLLYSMDGVMKSDQEKRIKTKK